MNTKVNWTTAYEAAVFEIDNAKLAEEAISARLRTLPIGQYQERLAMQKAITALEILRRARLGNQH
jgi:hypothetical protein